MFFLSGPRKITLVKYSLKTLFIFVAICAIAIVIGIRLNRATSRYVGTSENGVSTSVANKMLSAHLRLPASASDVSYYVDFGAEEAEFAISEQDFLKWCHTQGWAVEPIRSPVAYFEPMAMPDDSRQVDRGYHFSPPDGQGTFDADRSRACFWTSTFP